MSERSDKPESAPEPPPANQTSDKSDLLALGVGCLVFLIMFVAIVLVGMSGR